MRDVYLLAAENIAQRQHEYSCLAVGHISDEARILYESIFFDGCKCADPLLISQAVRLRSYPDPCWDEIKGHYKGIPQKMIDLRVMLLCMAAACWKDFV